MALQDVTTLSPDSGAVVALSYLRLAPADPFSIALKQAKVGVCLLLGRQFSSSFALRQNRDSSDYGRYKDPPP